MAIAKLFALNTNAIIDYCDANDQEWCEKF